MIFPSPKTLPFLLCAATSTTAVLHDTLLPSTKPPTTTRDPWQCATETLPQYFDVPKPTGALATALQSYNLELIADCEPTGLNAYGVPGCAFPEPSQWCAFPTAAPSTLLPAYSSYASSASVWWAERKEKAIELAEECPQGWFKAMVATPGGAGWLNQTLILGKCYAEAHPSSEERASSETTVAPTATMVEGGVTRTGAVPTTTDAAAKDTTSLGGKTQDVEMWVLAATVAAVTSML